jgi:anti-anti-sigma factor
MPRDVESHLISISRIHKHAAAEISCVRFRGTVRQPTEPEFSSRLDEAGHRSPHLVVDLSELEYLSANGLGMLLDQAGAQERRGGWLRIISPSPTVAMILHLAGASSTFTPFADLEDAARDLSERAA